MKRHRGSRRARRSSTTDAVRWLWGGAFVVIVAAVACAETRTYSARPAPPPATYFESEAPSGPPPGTRFEDWPDRNGASLPPTPAAADAGVEQQGPGTGRTDRFLWDDAPLPDAGAQPSGSNDDAQAPMRTLQSAEARIDGGADGGDAGVP